MSTQCQGTTLKGSPCTKKVKLPATFCYNHVHQQNRPVEVKEKVELKKEEKVELEKKEEVKPILGDCVICMCELDPQDDCGLQCKHTFHLECLKPLRTPSCPVCRGTLEGSKLDAKALSEIANKQQQDKNERDNAASEALARAMQQQMNPFAFIPMIPMFNPDFDGDEDDEEADIARQIAFADLMHRRREQQNANRQNANRQNANRQNGNMPPQLNDFIQQLIQFRDQMPNGNGIVMHGVVRDNDGNIIHEMNF